MEKLYTVGEIAKELSIPESTASYYIRTFIEYMPVVGEGRRKRYKPEVLEIVALIRQAFNNHLAQEQVSELLAQRYSLSVEPEKDVQIYNNSLIEQQQVIKQMAATIVDLQNQISDIRAEVKQHDNERRIAEEERRLDLNERDRRLMELIRTIQEERQETLWQKICKRFR